MTDNLVKGRRAGQGEEGEEAMSHKVRLRGSVRKTRGSKRTHKENARVKGV